MNEIVLIVVIFVFAIVIGWLMAPQHKRKLTTVVIIAVLSLSIGIWVMIKPNKVLVQQQPPVLLSIDEAMQEVQDKLRISPNDGELWLNLGQLYLAEKDLQAALTCFDYSLRLIEAPSADVYAAKALTIYYQRSQVMSEQVTDLINTALEIDEYNEAALTLLASDAFISFDYDKAIAYWQKILDSERMGLDRVNIINSINEAQLLSDMRSKKS
jgi:formate-dependent nitrite reductase complex subunit NrfG